MRRFFFGGGGGEGLDHPVCRFQFLFYDLSRKLSRSKELLSPVKWQNSEIKMKTRGMWFCTTKRLFAWYWSDFLWPMVFVICRHCLAILPSGRLSKWIQSLITFMSIVSFNGDILSLFLQAAFGHCLFARKKCFHKDIWVFSMVVLSQ